MELLSNLKELFEILVKAKIEKKIPKLEQLEKIADEVYDGDYKAIDKYLIPVLSINTYNSIKQCIEKIKETIKNEKESR